MSIVTRRFDDSIAAGATSEAKTIIRSNNLALSACSNHVMHETITKADVTSA